MSIVPKNQRAFIPSASDNTQVTAQLHPTLVALLVSCFRSEDGRALLEEIAKKAFEDIDAYVEGVQITSVNGTQKNITIQFDAPHHRPIVEPGVREPFYIDAAKFLARRQEKRESERIREEHRPFIESIERIKRIWTEQAETDQVVWRNNRTFYELTEHGREIWIDQEAVTQKEIESIFGIAPYQFAEQLRANKQLTPQPSISNEDMDTKPHHVTPQTLNEYIAKYPLLKPEIDMPYSPGMDIHTVASEQQKYILNTNPTTTTLPYWPGGAPSVASPIIRKDTAMTLLGEGHNITNGTYEIWLNKTLGTFYVLSASTSAKLYTASDEADLRSFFEQERSSDELQAALSNADSLFTTNLDVPEWYIIAQ